MNIAINKAHFPVTVLGPGKRIAIWFQGCSIGCKGCLSQDTWAVDPAREMPLDQLLEWCREVTHDQFDGITLSGGEPFDQPQALCALLDGLLAWRLALGRYFDILCYSGYPMATLERQHPALLAKIDALISEPFVEALPVTHVWRGSSNQRLHVLSVAARDVYGPFVDAATDPADKRIQVNVQGGHVWYIGIPSRGDLDALAESCTRQGLHFQAVSWRQ